MGVLTQEKYLGDWLVDEFGAPNYCREEVVVLAPVDLPSGQVLGVESSFSKYARYDNSDPAAAAGVLVNAIDKADANEVTSIVDLSDAATVTTPVPHGLIVGDIVCISGATADTDLNGNYAVATVPTTTTFTIVTANVTDATYTEATLRITKLNHAAAMLSRGPATISKAGLDWGDSDSTGITAGLVDLLALLIVAREGV